MPRAARRAPRRGRRTRRRACRGSPARHLALAREQAPVQRHELGTGRDAELVAQQAAQLLVDAQRLGDVAGRRERLHQQPVAALAVRRARDQLARGGLAADALERRQPQLLDLLAPLARPRGVDVREEAGADQLQCRAGIGAGGSVDVHDDRLRQHESQALATLDLRRRQRSPQAREDRPQRRQRLARRPVGPQHVDQVATVDRPAAVRQQVGEQRARLPGGQRGGHIAPVDLHAQRAAQADLGPHSSSAIRAAARAAPSVSTGW